MTTKIPVELSSTPGIVDGSNATAITIDSSENVGIGQTSPSSPNGATDFLHIGNSSSTFTSLVLEDNNNTWEIFQNNQLSIRDGTDTRLLIDTSGNVGIGTTSPAGPLDVVSNSSAVGIELRGRSADNIGQLSFESNDSGTTYSQLQSLSTELKVKTVANIPMSFHTNNTERMRIDSSGDVGIKTTNPLTTLHVEIDDSNDQLFIADSRAYNTSTLGGILGFGGKYNSSSNITTWAQIHGIKDNTTDGSFAGHLRFATRTTGALTERMRILSTGLIAIGTTVNTVAKMHIVESESRDCLRLTNTRNPASSAPYVATFGFNFQPNNGTSTFLACQDDLDGSPTSRLTILSNGGISNFQSNNSNLSDARLKTEIQDAPNALDIINNLKVRTFKYHDQTDEKIHTGLIAQETETVDLSLVNQDGWADKAPEGEEPYKSIYNTDLMFKMLKAIQEQQEQIEQLKTEIQTLKGE